MIQTRTFRYDTTTQSRLHSTTNPENGTVTYTYNADGTTATKTDARGIRTEFSYDAYKRVTQMSKLQQTAGNWVEQRCERVSYVYDELWGREYRAAELDEQELDGLSGEPVDSLRG